MIDLRAPHGRHMRRVRIRSSKLGNLFSAASTTRSGFIASQPLSKEDLSTPERLLRHCLLPLPLARSIVEECSRFALMMEGYVGERGEFGSPIWAWICPLGIVANCQEAA